MSVLRNVQVDKPRSTASYGKRLLQQYREPDAREDQKRLCLSPASSPSSRLADSSEQRYHQDICSAPWFKTRRSRLVSRTQTRRGQNPCVSPAQPRPRGTTSPQPPDMKSTCACCAYSRHVLFLSNLGETCTLLPGGGSHSSIACLVLITRRGGPRRKQRVCVGFPLLLCMNYMPTGGILAVLHPGRDVKLCYRDISWRNPTPFLTRRLSLDTTRCLGLVVKHPDSRPVSRGQMGYIWQNQSPVGHSAVGDSSALDTVGRTVEMMTLVEIRHAAYILGNTAELVRTWRK